MLIVYSNYELHDYHPRHREEAAQFEVVFKQLN